VRTRNNFSVGHPFSNRSRPSTLNLEFFSYELPKKKLQLVDMSILSILLSPEPGCHTSPLKEGKRRRRGGVKGERKRYLPLSMLLLL
jgi:hypothetical protein